MDLIVIALVLAWIAILVGVWVLYQIMAQNGRVLLRLEGLERQLGVEVGLMSTAAPPPGQADGSGEAEATAQESPRVGWPVGTILHDFDVPDLDGRRVVLSSFQGRRVLLIFVSPDCPHSRAMLWDLVALRAVASPSWPTPLILSTGTRDTNRRLAEQVRLREIMLLQEEMEVGALFSVPGTPMAYLVDEQRRTASALAAGRAAVLGLAASSPSADGSPISPIALPSDAVQPIVTPAPPEGERFRDGLPIGTPAPNVRLPRLDEGEVVLSALLGRQVLLVFAEPECPPCDALMPRLEQLHRALAQLTFLLIARGDPAVVREWVARFSLSLPTAIQPRRDVSRQFRMLATPSAYLIDERGLIAEPVAVGPEAILALVARVRALAAQ